jgi:hypothetical protein
VGAFLLDLALFTSTTSTSHAPSTQLKTFFKTSVNQDSSTNPPHIKPFRHSLIKAQSPTSLSQTNNFNRQHAVHQHRRCFHPCLRHLHFSWFRHLPITGFSHPRRRCRLLPVFEPILLITYSCLRDRTMNFLFHFLKCVLFRTIVVWEMLILLDLVHSEQWLNTHTWRYGRSSHPCCEARDPRWMAW